MKSDLVDISVSVHHETMKAVLVSTSGIGDEAVWIPKSQCEIEPSEHGGIYTLTLPERVAIEKGLV